MNLWNFLLIQTLILSILINYLIASTTFDQLDDASSEEWETTQATRRNSLLGKEPQASCDVFDPFKVLPSDSGHFQLGGAFPLHTEDCLTLKPSSVQDVVAIQWAMAYWNEQNGRKNNSKKAHIGLFAGDSCSRPKEAISQSLRFLDAVGFHDPSECLINNKEALKKKNETSKLIAVLSPKDNQSATSVAQALKPYNLPFGVFSSSSAQALLDQGVTGFISTAPLLSDYAQALAELLELLGKSNLISIVDSNEDSLLSDKFVETIQHLNISIAEIINYNHQMLLPTLKESDAQIIVSTINKNLLSDLLHFNKELFSISKLWVIIDWPSNSEENDSIEQHNYFDFIPNKTTKLQFVIIRPQQRYLADFNAYFLRLLVTNYEHYSLLNAYVKTVYNCSKEIKKGGKVKIHCEEDKINPSRLAELHRQSSSLESIIPLVFALARTAQRINTNLELNKEWYTFFLFLIKF